MLFYITLYRAWRWHVTVGGDSHREIFIFCHRHRHRRRKNFHRDRHRRRKKRWLDKTFSKTEETSFKFDSTSCWEYIVTTEVIEDRIYEPLALYYYKIATVIPAEVVVEGFFSIVSFIFDGRHYSLDSENLKSICLFSVM